MSNPAVVLFVLAMVGVIVAVDLLFFRKTWFWERLAANVGIVLVFGASTPGFPVVHERCERHNCFVRRWQCPWRRPRSAQI